MLTLNDLSGVGGDGHRRSIGPDLLHDLRNHRHALLLRRCDLGAYLRTRTDMARGVGLIHPHGAGLKGQVRKRHIEVDCHALHPSHKIPFGLRLGADHEVPDLVVKRNAALRFDVAVTAERALRQARPNGIGVENSSDAPCVVMTAKNALMRGAIRRLIRANHRHAPAFRGEMPRRRCAHQAFANHNVVVRCRCHAKSSFLVVAVYCRQAAAPSWFHTVVAYFAV